MNEDIKRRRKRKSRYYTGEDIDMFREREQERRKSREDNICDTHIDGAWLTYILSKNTRYPLNSVCYIDIRL